MRATCRVAGLDLTEVKDCPDNVGPSVATPHENGFRPMAIQGLSETEAAARLVRYGPNSLPVAAHDGMMRIFLRQFLSPLIYVLLAAAVVSAFMGDLEDAVFIGAVLLINGIVGTVQEYSAEKAAVALKKFDLLTATVLRDGVRRDIDAQALVPGDVVLLESGRRVPADARLLTADGLRCNESLLTGESEPARKSGPDAADADPRLQRVFSGSMITRGTGVGEVTATGSQTQFGQVAKALGSRPLARAPLLLRLDGFSKSLAIAIFAAIAVVVAIGLLRGMAAPDLFMAAVGLAVSAIPEGLPVAITVALSIAMRRMASHHVIMRNMPAIESLGSCTVIATDKTGTLTMNELTVTDIGLPDGTRIAFSDGDAPADEGLDHTAPDARRKMAALLRAAVLPTEASLVRDGDDWIGSGDTVDLALLAAARRGGLVRDHVVDAYPLIARIAYAPENKYAASFHDGEDGIEIFVKGAAETLIGMAETMLCDGLAVPIDRPTLLRQKADMAAAGLRVLAFAQGRIGPDIAGALDHRHLTQLTFLGLAGMKDPLRAEVPAAIAMCRAAGIGVAMITGDDPLTALAIARDAGLGSDLMAVTGADLQAAADKGHEALDQLTRKAVVYARIQPLQKLDIVESLARNGHIVAVTGDGINDAPALKHAHVGIAMGRKGADIARESADIILTGDNFASIVAGIREGRVAYGNIRKVIFMSVSTGAAEVLLFLLTVPFGLPIPLLAVQLLWLNLVTNGIQDVALATEKAEGDELSRPPHRADAPLFARRMIRRIVLSALFMAAAGAGVLVWGRYGNLPMTDIRNAVLLQLVIFENVLTLSARSERGSLFGRHFLSNPLLLGSVVFTQLLHVGAMYLPWLSATLRIHPVSAGDWLILLVPAFVLVAALELDKLLTRKGWIA